MGLEQLNFDGLNRVDVAIERIRVHMPKAWTKFLLADSGGKDSSVVRDLLIRARVPFEAVYNVTGIDAPELMAFIKEKHPDTTWHIPRPGIWQLFGTAKAFPTRQHRWCCELLKESTGKGRTVVTGIRWVESPMKRGTRGIFEICRTDGAKYFLNPIIDWSDKEVWQYIHTFNVPVCSLYSEGWKRLGCVLCPMGSAEQGKKQILRWPKIAENWHRAFLRCYEDKKDRESFQRWHSGEELWHWWLTRKGQGKENDCQGRFI